ncbi:MAG: hypothetical protein AAB551_03145 [Patescibacteria group bacterium]
MTKKLYTIGWISFASYLGGPLAGCYMLSKNFENFGKINEAEETLRIGTITTLLLFGLLAFIPESIMVHIPKHLIPVMYTIAIYAFTKKHQEKDIQTHLKNGGTKHSGWDAFWVSLVSFVASLAYALVLMFVLEKVFKIN